MEKKLLKIVRLLAFGFFDDFELLILEKLIYILNRSDIQEKKLEYKLKIMNRQFSQAQEMLKSMPKKSSQKYGGLLCFNMNILDIMADKWNQEHFFHILLKYNNFSFEY